MKTNMSDTSNRLHSRFLLHILVLMFIYVPIVVKSQQGFNLSGEIICLENGEAIAFANVALFDTSHTSIVSGAASDEAGTFKMADITPGTYNLQVSALGFESYRKEIDLLNGNLSLGVIGMSGKNLELKDVDVISRRIPAKQASGSTTFFISPKMQESSNLGTDILRLLPGVAVDLQQNISLEGSRNIIILVDGKERDGSYLSQLPASKIDKVEVISSPPARYDASVTGIINVLLTQNDDSGWDGHVYAEIPASGSEVFLTPAYSLNYGFGKVNLFTSYNGDLRRFNITETYERTVFDNPESTTITSMQILTQKTWSHKFHYGADWYLNDRNQLNFYGFYNPYSQELDGTTELLATGINPGYRKAEKNDDDINHSLFHSLWYKHIFNKTTGHDITLETSQHTLRAVNSTTYTDTETGSSVENKMQPDNRSMHIRLDYSLPLGKSTKISTGMQGRFRALNDKNQENFSYRENVYAGYGGFSFSNSKLETSVGLRIEYASKKLPGQEPVSWWHLLPNASVKHNLNNGHSVAFNYRRSLYRPGFYQLNSNISTDDPFTYSFGNPNLQPEQINHAYLEYSGRFNNHFLSTRLFYRHISDAIRNLMTLNPNGNFGIQSNNIGNIYQYGIQISGAIVLGKAGINPYVKLFDASSNPYQAAREHAVESRHQLVLESGLSAYVAFGRDFTASATFQYTSPMNEIQGNSFSGALYFLSLEKAFAKGLKAGVVSGLPLAKDFTYQGYEFESSRFSHRSTGKLNLSSVPLWIKISYQFASGGKRQKIERATSVPEREIRKGF